MPLQGGLCGQVHNPPRPLLPGRVLTATCISAVEDLRSHSASRSSWRPLGAALEPTPPHMESLDPDPQVILAQSQDLPTLGGSRWGEGKFLGGEESSVSCFLCTWPELSS